MHIIAADVGGTKTWFAFVNSEEPNKILYEARYLSGEFESFDPLLNTFINDIASKTSIDDSPDIDVLTLALPGLVSDTSARLTNLPWVIEKQALTDKFGIKNIYFMNDFQASAFGTGQLLEKDKVILNHGLIDPDDLSQDFTRVAVGAGTGLGVAWADSKYLNGKQITDTHSTEGGHIDFSPTNAIQIQLLQFLQQRYDHVSYERILSGEGLISLYQFCSGNEAHNVDAEWISTHVEDDEAADKAMSLFVQIYGAYIGNIALMFKPFGGIYITGGIAAKIEHKMRSNEFLENYLDKGRMRTLVEQITVYLVTNDKVGMLGALSASIEQQAMK